MVCRCLDYLELHIGIVSQTHIWVGKLIGVKNFFTSVQLRDGPVIKVDESLPVFTPNANGMLVTIWIRSRGLNTPRTCRRESEFAWCTESSWSTKASIRNLALRYWTICYFCVGKYGVPCTRGDILVSSTWAVDQINTCRRRWRQCRGAILDLGNLKPICFHIWLSVVWASYTEWGRVSRGDCFWCLNYPRRNGLEGYACSWERSSTIAWVWNWAGRDRAVCWLCVCEKCVPIAIDDSLHCRPRTIHNTPRPWCISRQRPLAIQLLSYLPRSDINILLSITAPDTNVKTIPSRHILLRRDCPGSTCAHIEEAWASKGGATGTTVPEGTRSDRAIHGLSILKPGVEIGEGTWGFDGDRWRATP